MGDLNCNLLKAANHLKSFLMESGLYCITYGSTFHALAVDSWLDVIIVDSGDKLVNYLKSDMLFIGDHFYLFCKYKLEH